MKFIDKFQRKIEQISLHSIALIIAYGLLSGCASVNPEPFTKYRNAVQEAQSGIDAAMSIDYAWTRTSYIENFSGNKESKFTMLMIQPGEKRVS